MKNLQARFEERFGRAGRIYRAPGRVNLIGEHTDYNDGFVMPAAVDFSTWVAAAPRDDRRLEVFSDNLGESASLDLDRPAARRGDWSDYVAGVAVVLEQAGYRLGGADLLVRGEVPLGSGLSSSAALEVSCGYALLALGGEPLPAPAQLARLCQRAENEYVGTRCGIMDQYISCCGRKDHALLLDCRALEHRHLPLPGSVRLVVCNSLVRHSLVDGEYNRRREACEQAVSCLREVRPEIRALRDVEAGLLERLEPAVRRLARHVVSENLRVERAASALEEGDLETFGGLMGESHRSLRDDYEVSCPELDLLVELAGEIDGVYGARLTGGGFGGCTVNLVRAEAVDEFRRRVPSAYEARTGRRPELYVCSASDGVGPAWPQGP